MKSNYEAALDVLAGKYGNGEERKKKLWNDGFNPDAVQSIVNALVKDRQSEREQEKEKGNFLTVEVDLAVYDGINLKFKQKG